MKAGHRWRKNYCWSKTAAGGTPLPLCPNQKRRENHRKERGKERANNMHMNSLRRKSQEEKMKQQVPHKF
eukprot:465210-Amphidinium_carterae.1